MATTIDFMAENARELARLRVLVAQLSDADLSRPVTPEWTVAHVLGHMAFWDSRALLLAQKLQRGEEWLESDYEADDVELLNGAVVPLIEAIEPRRMVELVLRLAETVDMAVARLPREGMWPYAEKSPLNCVRARHRGEHLDMIEAALRG